MLGTSILVSAVLVGVVLGMALMLADLYPELTRLRSENAQLREKWKRCRTENGIPTLHALVKR